ncbi:MAG: hypothetical protein ACM3JH_10610 [Acidithiobacillales bacterium]
MNFISGPLANCLKVLEQEAREGPAYEGQNFFESQVVRMAMEWARQNALDEAAAVVLRNLPDPSANDVARLIAERKRIPSLAGAPVGAKCH